MYSYMLYITILRCIPILYITMYSYIIHYDVYYIMYYILHAGGRTRGHEAGVQPHWQYIYIYIEREREREIHTYTLIFICTYTHISITGLRAVAAGSRGFMRVNKRRPSAVKTKQKKKHDRYYTLLYIPPLI